MNVTQGVSFPRSGHAAIYHVVKQYFGDALVYCDEGSDSFCGCGKVPCINPKRTYAKHHDFRLRLPRIAYRLPWGASLLQYLNRSGVPIDPKERYLIQFRSPVPAITSNFGLHVENDPRQNSLQGWLQFSMREIDYWNRFVDKWVLEFPLSATRPLFCSYEELVGQPVDKVREILTYLSDAPLDEDRVQAVLREVPIVARNKLPAFEYCDPGYLRKLEAKAVHRMDQLELPSFETFL